MRLKTGRYVVKTLSDAKRIIKFSKKVKQEAKLQAMTHHCQVTGTGKTKWHFVDARAMIAGRLAPRIVNLLMGKHKPSYNRRHDDGDFVVVVNASKVRLTGRKHKNKLYHWHTGWPGGLKSTTPARMHEKGQGEEILRKAVSGMLPKNKMRKHREKRLILFPDAETHGLYDDVIGHASATPLWFDEARAGTDMDDASADASDADLTEVPPLTDEQFAELMKAHNIDPTKQ